MKSFASSYSSGSALNNPSSPQYAAVQWLTQDEIQNGNNWLNTDPDELRQRYVIAVLHYSTNERLNLESGVRVCDWNSRDVNCGGDNVNDIDMYQDSLRGTIPSELAELTALTQLRLDDNNLSGEIPSELGTLTLLSQLALGQNPNLGGTIPPQLGSLGANLRELFLSVTGLTGTVPQSLTQLENLQVLGLDNTDLSGTIPSGFCTINFLGNPLLVSYDCSEVSCDCCSSFLIVLCS